MTEIKDVEVGPIRNTFGDKCPAQIELRPHCGHLCGGVHVRCCQCGAYEDALLEAVRLAAAP